MDVNTFLHPVACGALAAAGFGVLFNVSFRSLPWCAASGAFALAIRTIALGEGLALEPASFVAALVLGFAVLLVPCPGGVSRGALHVVGCIPMVPGAFAAKAILGFFAITKQQHGSSPEALLAALTNTTHVLFTLGALGTGLAIPTMLLDLRAKRRED